MLITSAYLYLLSVLIVINYTHFLDLLLLWLALVSHVQTNLSEFYHLTSLIGNYEDQ